MVVTLMRREKYETPPKSLTHLHDNHSLICLSLVIHRKSNGFSRVIVFLCFINIQAETVPLFLNLPISKYGTPY